MATSRDLRGSAEFPSFGGSGNGRLPSRLHRGSGAELSFQFHQVRRQEMRNLGGGGPTKDTVAPPPPRGYKQSSAQKDAVRAGLETAKIPPPKKSVHQCNSSWNETRRVRAGRSPVVQRVVPDPPHWRQQPRLGGDQTLPRNGKHASGTGEGTAAGLSGFARARRMHDPLSATSAERSFTVPKSRPTPIQQLQDIHNAGTPQAAGAQPQSCEPSIRALLAVLANSRRTLKPDNSRNLPTVPRPGQHNRSASSFANRSRVRIKELNAEGAPITVLWPARTPQSAPVVAPPAALLRAGRSKELPAPSSAPVSVPAQSAPSPEKKSAKDFPSLMRRSESDTKLGSSVPLVSEDDSHLSRYCCTGWSATSPTSRSIQESGWTSRDSRSDDGREGEEGEVTSKPTPRKGGEREGEGEGEGGRREGSGSKESFPRRKAVRNVRGMAAFDWEIPAAETGGRPLHLRHLRSVSAGSPHLRSMSMGNLADLHYKSSSWGGYGSEGQERGELGGCPHRSPSDEWRSEEPESVKGLSKVARDFAHARRHRRQGSTERIHIPSLEDAMRDMQETFKNASKAIDESKLCHCQEALLNRSCGNISITSRSETSSNASSSPRMSSRRTSPRVGSGGSGPLAGRPSIFEDDPQPWGGSSTPWTTTVLPSPHRANWLGPDEKKPPPKKWYHVFICGVPPS